MRFDGWLYHRDESGKLLPPSGYPALLSSACVALLALVACSAPAKAPERSGGTVEAAGTTAAPASDEIIVEKPMCAADNPFCQQSPIVTSTMTGDGTPLVPTSTDCGSLPIDLNPAGVNIMLAVDGSASMEAHWEDIGTAIRSLRANNPDASFGAHMFWADAVDPASEEGQQARNTTNNACHKINNSRLPLGAHSAQELVDFMGSEPPGGVIYDVYQVAPVIDALNTYLTMASELADPTKTNYLVVFTSGNDNCFGAAFTAVDDKLVAYQKLAVELHRRNIRLIPVGMDAPSDMPMNDPWGFGPGLTGTNIQSIKTDYKALGAMLEYGGSSLDEVPRIDTTEKLEELISVVGQSVNNCRFEIPAALDSSMSVNPFGINFSISGKSVPRDRGQMNGWNFVKGSTSQVEFYGQSCEALQTGLALEAGKSCSTDVCGTAAVSVSTKPRYVLLLLDSSASRIECADGSFDCLSTPGTPGRVLSFWEVVQHAVSEVLAAPINDEVAFGMQFFPGKDASEFSCEVNTTPEIPAAPGMQIQLMKSMLEKLPFGLSPVVGVMESVAAMPGNLVDPNVVGAVVLLSDGGDNCSGDMQPDIVSRLGDAAQTLFDQGVRTFAIRYGSADGETPDQAEQLNAIATAGGTALTSGSVKYIDAKSPDELGAALAGISDQLASCAFTLGMVDPSVDKDRTNLFLDGEQIGFDATNTKLDGWGWVDAEQTTVELYGAACTTFKTARNTNVVVEFGCEQMVFSPD